MDKDFGISLQCKNPNCQHSENESILNLCYYFRISLCNYKELKTIRHHENDGFLSVFNCFIMGICSSES